MSEGGLSHIRHASRSGIWPLDQEFSFLGSTRLRRVAATKAYSPTGSSHPVPSGPAPTRGASRRRTSQTARPRGTRRRPPRLGRQWRGRKRRHHEPGGKPEAAYELLGVVDPRTDDAEQEKDIRRDERGEIVELGFCRLF